METESRLAGGGDEGMGVDERGQGFFFEATKVFSSWMWYTPVNVLETNELYT